MHTNTPQLFTSIWLWSHCGGYEIVQSARFHVFLKAWLMKKRCIETEKKHVDRNSIRHCRSEWKQMRSSRLLIYIECQFILPCLYINVKYTVHYVIDESKINNRCHRWLHYLTVHKNTLKTFNLIHTGCIVSVLYICLFMLQHRNFKKKEAKHITKYFHMSLWYVFVKPHGIEHLELMTLTTEHLWKYEKGK